MMRGSGGEREAYVDEALILQYDLELWIYHSYRRLLRQFWPLNCASTSVLAPLVY